MYELVEDMLLLSAPSSMLLLIQGAELRSPTFLVLRDLSAQVLFSMPVTTPVHTAYMGLVLASDSVPKFALLSSVRPLSVFKAPTGLLLLVPCILCSELWMRLDVYWLLQG